MSKNNSRKPIIGVMGPGSPAKSGLTAHAENLGKEIALKGWQLLTGGRAAGVMAAASKGASEAGGTTIGILPGNNMNDASEFIQIPIVTGLGYARNAINILSSDVVVICGIGPGTASEAALAIKSGKPLLLTFIGPDDHLFFNRLAGNDIPCLNRIEALIAAIEEKIL